MKVKNLVVTGITTLLVLFFIIAPVSASEPSTIKIVNCTYPEIISPNEEGIIYLKLMNSGEDPVTLNNIYLKYYGNDNAILSSSTDWRNLPARILPHETLDVPLPIKAGEKTGTFYATICIDSNDGYVFDSKQPIVIKIQEDTPDLALTNFNVFQTDSYYTLTAEISNLGYAPANGLIVSTRGNEDVGPYSTYPIGNLDADDLAGFTLTFNMPENHILTFVTDYKDSNRNHVTQEHTLNVSKHLNVEEELPYMEIVLICAGVIVVGLIIFAIVRTTKKSKRH